MIDITENVFNSVQLRNELTKNLENIKVKVENEDIEQKEYQLLVETLIGERELMIEELDHLLYSQYRYHSTDSFNLNGMTMLVNNINDETINVLSVHAKKLNLSLSTLINILMEIVNNEFSGSFPTVSSNSLKQKLGRFNQIKINHLKSLIVTQNDLDELEEDELLVSFNHIERLDLSNISFHSFVKNVSSINHCKYVIIPNEWSKLILYFKSSWCDYYEFV